jgi:hypothetical protein
MITYRASRSRPGRRCRPGGPDRPSGRTSPATSAPQPGDQPTRVWVEQGEWPGRLYSGC